MSVATKVNEKAKFYNKSTDASLSLHYNTELVNSLNQHLRQQIVAHTAPSSVNVRERIGSSLTRAFSCALSGGDNVSVELGSVYDCLTEFYLSLPIENELRGRQYINHNGLVMAPNDAVRTITDSKRVSAFWRALSALLRKPCEGAQHLVYPACGPFAPLLLAPLLNAHQLNELNPNLSVTLIDIHPAAADTARELVTSLGLSEFVSVLCMDACDYQAEDESVDMLLLEAMQHGLGREAHLNILQHFHPLLSQDAVVVPENISIRAVLTDPNDEYPEQGRDYSVVNNKRVDLGSVLELNRHSLGKLGTLELEDGSQLIECNEVAIPEKLDSQCKPILLLTTRIDVAQGIWIDEYASGISHPLADLSVCINFQPKDWKSGDLLVRPGDKLKFYYRKLGLPGFLPTVSSQQ